MTEEAKARLEAMVRTSNGFEIAETDLELRGPGEFFGTRQSGSLGFQIANPMRDRAVLDLARQEAFALVEAATMPAASNAPSTAQSKEGAKQSANASPPVDELDRLLRRLPPEWQRRYHLARIG
jgi:ATP-dependent DNA helicase RecG